MKCSRRYFTLINCDVRVRVDSHYSTGYGPTSIRSRSDQVFFNFVFGANDNHFNKIIGFY